MKSKRAVVPQTTRAEMGGQLKLRSSKGFKKRKAKRRTVKKELPIVQELYASCKSVFKGPGFVASPSDEQTICRILDKMEPEDLALSKKMEFFNPENVDDGDRRVIYTNIYKCKNFTLDLFFFPPSAVIPLHNHPHMTVFSKLLIGEMHIKSYDWVDSENSKQPSGLRLAKLKADNVFTASCNTKVLYPTTGGNIHQFTAITPCLLLDVIAPPYSKEDGRDCTYYRDLPYEANTDTKHMFVLGDDEKYGWLEEIELPAEELRMDRIHYFGPPIIE